MIAGECWLSEIKREKMTKKTKRSPDFADQPRRQRFISLLTLRILTINILTLLIPIGGVLYLDDYREALIASEMAALESQGLTLAAALGAGAVDTGPFGLPALDHSRAIQVVLRIGDALEGRARLFDDDGNMLVDTELRQDGGSVLRSTLPPLDDSSKWAQWVEKFWTQWALMVQDFLTPFYDLPPYREKPIQRGEDFDEVAAALYGERAAMLRSNGDSGMILSVAIPVQRYKQVVGALMISRPGASVTAALGKVRGNILAIFAVALVATVLLSFYLAGTIARPLNRLAAAADRLRNDHDRRTAIPDFGSRGDEIGELSRSFRAMTTALWQRMDAIENFAADVAHEIKNPLTSLRSAVELVTDIKDVKKRRQLLGVIAQDIQRIDRLITDISEASRVDAELSRARRHMVDLGEMLTTLVDTIGDTTSPSIVIRRGKGDHRVMGLPGRLGQVWMNVITNAQSFSPPGGEIIITIDRQKVSGTDWVTVTVDDQGPGVPQESADRIFERFYQERPESEAFGNNSGLGLSIARQVIEAHSGTIKATNRVNDAGIILGARFTIRLPPAIGQAAFRSRSH